MLAGSLRCVGFPSGGVRALRGRADGVKRIRFGSVAALGTLGSVELDHDLIAPLEVSGQASTMAAGPFDRPDSQRSLLVSELH